MRTSDASIPTTPSLLVGTTPAKSGGHVLPVQDILHTLVQAFTSLDGPLDTHSLPQYVKASLACAAHHTDDLPPETDTAPLHIPFRQALEEVRRHATSPEALRSLATLLTATLFIARQGKQAFGEHGAFRTDDYLAFLQQHSGLAHAQLEPLLYHPALEAARLEASESAMLPVHFGADLQIDIPDPGPAGKPVLSAPADAPSTPLGAGTASSPVRIGTLDASAPPSISPPVADPAASDPAAAMILLQQAYASGQIVVAQKILEEQPALLTLRNENGDLPLHMASMAGDLQTIQGVLERHPEQHAAGSKYGDTALHCAAYHGQLPVIRWLISRYPTLASHRNDMGNTALMLACNGGQLAAVQHILQADPAQIGHQNNEGSSALHFATAQGELAIVQWLLTQQPELIAQTRKCGDAAIHVAIVHYQPATMRWLLDTYPATAQQKSRTGANILQLACGKPVRRESASQVSLRQQIVEQIVLRHPELLEQPSRYESLPLHHACNFGPLQLAQLVFNKRPDLVTKASHGALTVLHHALMGRELEIVNWLLRMEVDLTGKDADRSSILHFALISGLPQAVPLLLAKYPDLLDRLSQEEASPRMTVVHHALHLAAQHDTGECIQRTFAIASPDYRAGLWQHIAQSSHDYLALAQDLVKQRPALLARRDNEGNNAFHLACRFGQLDTARIFLALDGSLAGMVNSREETALHLASRHGQPAAVRWLCDIMDRDAAGQFDMHGQHALHVASSAGHMDVMQCLHTHYPGLIRERVSGCGRTVLHLASTYDHLEVFTWLLQVKPNLIDKTDARGGTVLHSALQSGSRRIVQWLLEHHPALIGIRDLDGQPPLLVAGPACIDLYTRYLAQWRPEELAVRCDHGDTILHSMAGQRKGAPGLITLIQLADELGWHPTKLLTQQNEDGNTALHVALQSDRRENATVLLQRYPRLSVYRNSDGKTALHIAALNNFPEAVQQLLAISPRSVTAAADNAGDTALHLSCKNVGTEIIQVLLAHQPQLAARQNHRGETALHTVMRNFDENLLPPDASGALEAMLAAHPALPILADRDGITPLDLAFQSNRPGLVRAMLERCPELLVLRSEHGNTLLHRACAGGHQALAEWLLQQQPDLVGQVNDRHATALHAACTRETTPPSSAISLPQGLPGLLHALLERGADLHAADRDGNTPLHYAVLSGAPQTVKHLLRCGASVLVSNHRGLDACALAIREQQPEIAALLEAHREQLKRTGLGQLRKRELEGHTHAPPAKKRRPQGAPAEAPPTGIAASRHTGTAPDVTPRVDAGLAQPRQQPARTPSPGSEDDELPVIEEEILPTLPPGIGTQAGSVTLRPFVHAATAQPAQRDADAMLALQLQDDEFGERQLPTVQTPRDAEESPDVSETEEEEELSDFLQDLPTQFETAEDLRHFVALLQTRMSDIVEAYHSGTLTETKYARSIQALQDALTAALNTLPAEEASASEASDASDDTSDVASDLTSDSEMESAAASASDSEDTEHDLSDPDDAVPPGGAPSPKPANGAANPPPGQGGDGNGAHAG